MVAPQRPIGQLDALKTAGQAEVVEGSRFTCFVLTPVVSALVDAWSRRTGRTHAQEDAVIAARRLPWQ